MTGPPRNRYDLAWRRGNLVALLIACVLAAGWLAARGLADGLWLGREPRVDRSRVDAADEKIDPNTAGVASLLRLPGVGPVKARAIVEYRDAHGPRAFRFAEDLAEVHGIGPSTVREVARHLSIPSRQTDSALQPAGAVR